MHASDQLSDGGAERIDLEVLGERIARTAALIDAATDELLRDLRAYDAAEGWAQQGALSCAHWLSWRTGMDLGAARERVRVARALGSLPEMQAALARAEVRIGGRLAPCSACAEWFPAAPSRTGRAPFAMHPALHDGLRSRGGVASRA